MLCHGDSLRGVRSYSSSVATGSNHRPVGALVEFTVHQIDPQLQANLRRQLRYVGIWVECLHVLACSGMDGRLSCDNYHNIHGFAQLAVRDCVPGKCARPYRNYPTGRTIRRSLVQMTQQHDVRFGHNGVEGHNRLCKSSHFQLVLYAGHEASVLRTNDISMVQYQGHRYGTATKIYPKIQID